MCDTRMLTRGGQKTNACALRCVFPGSARASCADFGRLAEILLLVQSRKVLGEAPKTAREGACAPRI
jgi:hypothetical protein